MLPEKSVCCRSAAKRASFGPYRGGISGVLKTLTQCDLVFDITDLWPKALLKARMNDPGAKKYDRRWL